MQITHIAGIDLAANGWEIVADPMLTGNAGDNWQQTDIGLLNDYPRPFQLTLLTRSPTRTTITQRVRALLHALNQRDYHHNPDNQLRMQVTHNSVLYFVMFEPREVQAGLLQWTGSQYAQRVAIAGIVRYPPYRQNPQTLTISSLTAFNALFFTLGTSGTYWSPATLNLVNASGVGRTGGVWIGLTETGYPSSVIINSIPNSTPSSSPITFGAAIARQMPTAGTYTYTMTWGILGVTYDYWLHINAAATITVALGSETIAVIVANPNQFCYYVGRFSNEITVTLTVTTTTPNVILYPVIQSHPVLSRCVISSVATPINTRRITWGNPATSTVSTYITTINFNFVGLAGALTCLAPPVGRIVATWSTHTATMTGNFSRFEIEQGLL